MNEDLFYLFILIMGAWALITSLWMLDYLLCKYWPYKGNPMEDGHHEHWVDKYLREFDGRKSKRLRVLELENEHLARLKFFFADFIIESLLKRQDNGELDAKEVAKELDRLGNLFDMPDLVPRNQQVLKETIKRRLANKEAYVPVELPGPKTKTKNRVFKTKPNPFTHSKRLHRWHTVLRSWLRTKVSRPPTNT